MCVVFVLTIMVLTTEEKVFMVEHYFWSHGVGRQNGPSLRCVREHYEEQFNKTAPSNKTILAIVEKFHLMGSVLCQQEQLGARGLSPQTRIMNYFSNKCYSPQSIVFQTPISNIRILVLEYATKMINLLSKGTRVR